MIYARAYGKVSRAPAEQVRASGVTVTTVGLTVNCSGEFLRVNATAVGEQAKALMEFHLGDNLEVSGPIQPRTYVDKAGIATSTFDLKVHEVSRPQANRHNQA